MTSLPLCSYCRTPGLGSTTACGPLLACTGLCSNFVHEQCYNDRNDAGWCQDCCPSEKKSPKTKHVFVRVVQLMNLVLSLQNKIDLQDKVIAELRGGMHRG